jgi:hypothetical protein
VGVDGRWVNVNVSRCTDGTRPTLAERGARAKRSRDGSNSLCASVKFKSWLEVETQEPSPSANRASGSDGNSDSDSEGVAQRG